MSPLPPSCAPLLPSLVLLNATNTIDERDLQGAGLLASIDALLQSRFCGGNTDARLERLGVTGTGGATYSGQVICI